jgi:hypothetical protein
MPWLPTSDWESEKTWLKLRLPPRSGPATTPTHPLTVVWDRKVRRDRSRRLLVR